jgi:carbon-monoxide dehydrogenase medium subunit
MKAEHQRGGALWAGGTDLLLQWRRGVIDVEYCIDISGLADLQHIETDDDVTTIGAMVTIASLLANERIGAPFPVLAEMATSFATPQVRTIATLGGNLCSAVPSADSAPPLIALGAEVVLLSPAGERALPLESFFVDAKRTALAGDELLTHIRIPHPPPRSACTFKRIARSSVDIALVNAACNLTLDTHDRIFGASIVLGAVAPIPFRSERAEQALIGIPVAEVTETLAAEAGALAAADARPISDVRTGAAYRTRMSSVLASRAIADATRSLTT